MKTARELALKVLGSAKGLEKDAEIPGSDVYKMRMGTLHVEIRPDWFDSGLITLVVDNYTGQRLSMLFDPDTLEEDFDAEDRQKQLSQYKQLRAWVGTYGPDACKERIDKAWNENQ